MDPFVENSRRRIPAVHLDYNAPTLGVSTVLVLGIIMGFSSQLPTDRQESVRPNIVPASWVKGLTLTVEAPSYTGLRPKYTNTNGTINVLSGSTIKGIATTVSKSPLMISLPDGSNIETEASGQRIAFEFVATQSGKWAFAKKNEGGESVTKETKPRTLTVLPDKPPTVTRLKPKKDQSVTESDLIQLVYEAKDDFGLVQSTLVVALDGDLEQAERTPLDQLNGKQTKNAAELDLSLFDIQSGDRIAVYIECLDQKPPNGQVGRSKALYLTIESAEKTIASWQKT